MRAVIAGSVSFVFLASKQLMPLFLLSHVFLLLHQQMIDQV